MTKDLVTITVTVNVAAGNKWEGNSEIKVNLPEDMLKYINTEEMADSFKDILVAALVNYEEKNS